MTVFNKDIFLKKHLLAEWEEGCKKGLCQGDFEQYQPWISIRDFHSQALRKRIPSAKFGRIIHVMSSGEQMLFNRFEWDDHVYSVKEQIALDPELTLDICRTLNVAHPGSNKGGHVMTSDFLVTYQFGLHTYDFAFQVKHCQEELTDRNFEIISIEREYWKRKNTGFALVYSKNFNQVFHANLNLFYSLRQRSLPEQEIAFLISSVASIIKSSPDYLYTALNITLNSSPVLQYCYSLQEALMILCALKILRFPIRHKHLSQCRLSDFSFVGDNTKWFKVMT